MLQARAQSQPHVPLLGAFLINASVTGVDHTVFPKTHLLKPHPPVPQNGTIFGETVFTEVTKSNGVFRVTLTQ